MQGRSFVAVSVPLAGARMDARLLALCVTLSVATTSSSSAPGEGRFSPRSDSPPPPLPYLVDDFLGLGREFDGIGGISGGGATSRFLQDYPEPQRSEILDYLFKPNFGASLHIFKVEIGGDSNSAEGVESSHMRTADDLNFNRGYEWWMMEEAKKRNPDIKLYGLPWVFPGWLGEFSPYGNKSSLVEYITNWISGAASAHNLTINYIGIWNERPYEVDYIKMLRRTLDMRGFGHVRIVAADREWDFLPDMMKDRELVDSVDAIGVHYPATHSPPEALTIDRKLWASEEYSAYNDLRGGACWARVLNEGYVNGHLTCNIAWNIIASYFEQLPYPRDGLMTAEQPWSGNYDVSSPIWITAHHTQFMKPGWRYLLHEYGVGNLTGNGTYVALTSPDKSQLTIVIETMDPRDVPCFYPMPKYFVQKPQNATFQLRGTYAKIKSLNVWFSSFDFRKSEATLFKKLEQIQVRDGFFTLYLDVNVVYTLTTLSSGQRGSHGTPPKPANFPSVFNDDFDAYEEDRQPRFFAQQCGAFEIKRGNFSGHGKVMAQLVPKPGISICHPTRMVRPINFIGNYNAQDVSIEVDVMVPSTLGGASGVFIGFRVNKFGCYHAFSDGLYMWIYPAGNQYIVSGNLSRSYVYKVGSFQMELDQWITLRMYVKGNNGAGYINNVQVFEVTHITSANGFSALGTEDFGIAYFDNFHMNITKTSNAQSTDRRREYSSETRRSWRRPFVGFDGNDVTDHSIRWRKDTPYARNYIRDRLYKKKPWQPLR